MNIKENVTIRGTFGTDGEKKIGIYLENLGYKIVEFNYRYKYNIGEIDIIAMKNSTITFVEVKRRKKIGFASPGEIVNLKKRNSIIKTAELYLMQNNLNTNLYIIRFDIAYINNINIEYFENAFTKL